MEDFELVKSLFDGEKDALCKIEEKYEKWVYRIVKNILRDPRDIEEVINDVWLKCWELIPPNRPDSLKYYLRSIAENMARKKLEYLSAEKRKLNHPMPGEELEKIPQNSDPVMEYINTKILMESIDQFLRGLKKEKRQIFILCYWHGMDLEKIAAQTGRSKTYVRNALYQMKRKLTEHLKSL